MWSSRFDVISGLAGRAPAKRVESPAITADIEMDAGRERAGGCSVLSALAPASLATSDSLLWLGVTINLALEVCSSDLAALWPITVMDNL